MREIPSAFLLIAGSDDRGYAAQLRGIAQALGIGSVVRVVSSPDASQKAALFHACDVFVTPSDNIQESFGLTVLEAMSYSKPVVASDWNGYRDLVRDGTTGFLIPTHIYRPALDAADLLLPVDPASHFTTGLVASQTVVDLRQLSDRLAELIRSRHLRLSMGHAGRKVVQAEYNWRIIAARYRELFNEQVRIRLCLTPSVARRCLPEAFGHYGTGHIGAATRVRTAQDDSMADIAESGFIGPRDTVMAILQSAVRPKSISRLTMEIGDQSLIMRLLKLGLLQLCEG